MKTQVVCLYLLTIAVFATATTHDAKALQSSNKKLQETSDPYFKSASGKPFNPAPEPVVQSNGSNDFKPSSTSGFKPNQTRAPANSDFKPVVSKPTTTSAMPTAFRQDVGGGSGTKPMARNTPQESQGPQGSQSRNVRPQGSQSRGAAPQGSQSRGTTPQGSQTRTNSQPQASPATTQNATDGSQESFEPSRVLARVGDQPIFVSDLAVESMQLVDKFIGSAPMSVKKQEAKNLIPRLLPRYIQRKTLLVDAVASLPEGANVDEIFKSAGEQFDEIMVTRLMENVNVKSPAELDAYYRALGSSLRKVKKSWVEDELVKYTMRSKVNANLEVSHREIHDYYLANKQQYAVQAKVKWEQLLVRFDKFPNREAAQQALAAMGDEVVYGAPLPAVAKRSSQGFKASEGGQQGWTTKGSLVDKKLDEVLFNIEPGKLSAMLPVRDGMAIIRVIERTPAGFIPFEKSQKEIKEKLRSEKQDMAIQEHIATVKARVPVEIFDPTFVSEQPEDGAKKIR